MTDDPRYYGIYRGVVVNNADPKNKFRLQLRVPQLSGVDVTDWAECATTNVNFKNTQVTLSDPQGGSVVIPAGTFQSPTTLQRVMPAVGATVWVMYEGGDPNYPVWFG